MATETTNATAVDEMYGIVNDVWKAAIDAPLSTVMDATIRWPGTPKPASASMDKHWIRVSMQNVIDSQSSLANANGVRRYRVKGLFYVQLFSPRIQPSRCVEGRIIAQAFQTAFRKPSPSGSIEFRNVVIRELPPTDENYPFNVVVNYEFDSIQ